MNGKSRFLMFVLGVGMGLTGICPGGTTPTTHSSAPSASKIPSGWVHIQGKNLVDEMSESQAEGREDQKPPELYINKTENGKCEIRWMGEKKEIRFYNVKNGDLAQYDSSQKFVAFGTMHPKTAEKVRTEVGKFPLTIEEVVEQLKEEGAQIVQFNQVPDGGMTRTEISYIPGTNCKTCPQEGGKDLIWTDPKTGFIHKIQTQLDHPQEITYTYEKQTIKDIYGFGVPKDTKVLDYRPTPQAKAVLDRLDQNFQRDFGQKYLVVLTETDHRKKWGTKKMFLYLYARDGDKVLSAIYAFRPEEYPSSPILGLQGWPKPKIDDVLTLAKTTVPIFYYATDSAVVWTGTFDQLNISPPRIKEHKAKYKDYPLDAIEQPITHVWKGREKLHLYDFGPLADTIADPSKPKLVGLRLRMQDLLAKGKSPFRTEQIFWIDPAHGDLTVKASLLAEKIGPDKKMMRLNQHWTYDHPVQLPNGPWYPTHWIKESWTGTSPDEKSQHFSREFYLQIVPNLTLDPSWYGERTQALKTNGVKVK